MRTKLSYILMLAFTCLSWSADAQNKQPLPQVLVIGDAIYNQHARNVTSELKGKANVVIMQRPYGGEVVNSQTILNMLDEALGRIDRNGKPVPQDKWPSWDLIHVNVGLGDLVYRVPGLKSLRLLPIHAGGVVTTGPKEYENNLNELIRQLKDKAKGAKIVWASTTPIRHSTSNVFRKGSEIEYNKIAERVMKKHRVPINDMHAYAVSIMNMDKPASHGADPFNFDKKQIHPPIVEVIARELRIKLDKKKEDLAKAG